MHPAIVPVAGDFVLLSAPVVLAVQNQPGASIKQISSHFA
jgi:hypothetical protein